VIGGQWLVLPLIADCPSARVRTPPLLKNQGFLRGSAMQRMCSIVHFFFCLLLRFQGKPDCGSLDKSRFDNHLAVAPRVDVGAGALAAQVLLTQARKEAADAE
jgi:hypothetical protein